MKIWCNQREKEKLIRILAKEDSACVFDRYICVQDDCEECLNKNIKWVTKGGTKLERPEDKRKDDYERRSY